jgi:putative transposase
LKRNHVSYLDWVTGEYRAMDPKEVVLNYLTDKEEGTKHLITWFLKEVMQEEADQQAGAGRYRKTSSRKAYRNGH